MVEDIRLPKHGADPLIDLVQEEEEGCLATGQVFLEV